MTPRMCKKLVDPGFNRDQLGRLHAQAAGAKGPLQRDSRGKRPEIQGEFQTKMWPNHSRFLGRFNIPEDDYVGREIRLNT